MREPEGNRKVAPFVGSIEVPPDKSISHRALMLASMAEGTSHLTNLLNSQDVRSTASCMSALGAKVDVGVSGKKFFDADVTGWGGRSPKSPEEPLDCGNSGTTTRLLLGMLSGYDVTATLVGDESLSKRPMQRVVKPLSMMGARFSKPGGEVWTEGEIVLPIQVEGTSGLKGIDYSSPKASAQVKTSILLAAIHCDGSADLAEPYQSRNHTELMFPAFGLQLEAGNCKVHMDGGQKVTPCDVHVPGDVSSAMFPIVAASLVPGSHIKILNLGLNPTRTAAIEVARRMGCSIKVEPQSGFGGEPVGNVEVEYVGGLRGVNVGAGEVPNLIDEIPILALLATSAIGTTIFENVSELRVKESNRLEAIVEGLNALGCHATEKGDDLLIEGGVPVNDVVLPSRGDHRLAMTWAIANRCFGLDGGVDGMECTDVSFPGFEEELERLQQGGDR